MTAINVLGTPLLPCSFDPLTGFFRDGSCQTDTHDHGTHVVCARVTQAFLEDTLAQGNDLITPRPEYRFAGLKPGDRWCLCALRWREALQAGVAPAGDFGQHPPQGTGGGHAGTTASPCHRIRSHATCAPTLQHGREPFTGSAMAA